MEAQCDFLIYLYGYILKLIDTQENSLKLNEAFSKVVEGDYTNYDTALELSKKMNQNIIDLMEAREVLSAFSNVYTKYIN
ncbi:MAG TPA: hypothetical protein VIL26_04570 [Clostridia bacterium]